MSKPYRPDHERRAANRGTVYARPDHLVARNDKIVLPFDSVEKTPVTAVSPIQRRRDNRNVAKGIALGTLAALAGLLAAAFLGGCAPVHQKPPETPAKKMGSSLIFPGGGSSSGGGGTVTQGTAAAGSGAWPVTLTNTSDVVVKPGDSVNSAVRVNVVAGGAAGGTSSTFGAAVPGTGTAAGASDGTNMQLPRVFDGDSGAGAQYVSGSILRKSASGGTVEAGTSTDPLRVDPTGTTTQPVAGGKTNNGAAPSTDNVGTLSGVANAADPTWIEGRFVTVSVDLAGYQRVSAKQSGTWTVAQGAPASTANRWPVQITNGSNLATVTGSGALFVSCDNCGSAILDKASFGFGGTAVTAIGFVVDEVTPNTVTEDRAAIPRMSTNRVPYFNLRDGLGNERGAAVDASNQLAVAAAQTGTWTVQPGNTANTTPWLIQGSNSVTNTGASANFLNVASGFTAASPFATLAGRMAEPSLDSDNTSLRVSGAAEHDVTAALSDPLLVGGYASAAAPTDVSTDGDAVRAWFRRNGAQVINEAFGGTLASTGTGAADGGTKRVAVASDSTITPRTVSSANNTGTCTSVGTSSTTVLASNASRKAYGFKAQSTNAVAVFCKLGATATASNMPFEAGSSWTQDSGAVYTGVIDCITASSTANVCVYEFN